MRARALLPLACALGLACVPALSGCGRPDAPPEGRPDVPASGALNAVVLDALRAYPTDGTHRFHWPKGDPWRGTTRTLTYAGEVLCAGDPEGRCYCSGLTFEVFLEAWLTWARSHGLPERVAGLDLAGLKAFQSRWYGTDGDRQTLRTALKTSGLGHDVKDWETARPGDFVQLWRHDGSGHCAVFLAWERDAHSAISGLSYWSTQKATNGIGERTERFGDVGRAVKRDETYVVRVGRAP